MSEDIRGLINRCPLCGIQLKDDTQKTRWNHDKQYHPDYFSAQTRLKLTDLIDKEKLK